MGLAGAALRHTSDGGKKRGGASLRRRRAAAAWAVAALVPLTACQTTPPPNPAEARLVMENVRSGLALYESRDFVLAAHRFNEAAAGARNCEDLGVERRATTAECTSWLRARRLPELASCTQRLEVLHRRERRSDPALNTLLAMGAVAGHRPLPPFRVPSAVHPIVRKAAQ